MLLACLLLSTAACGVTQVLDRAEDGTPIVIRTPQPDVGDLVELRDDYGVRTVLNLRGDRADREERYAWYDEERAGVKAIEARWEHLDISGTLGPTPAQVTAFFDLVEDPDAWPIVMHCQGGVHRTGVMAALYRIQYQGWTGDEAVAEMEDHWFDWTTRDRDAIKRFLRGYEPDPARLIVRAAPQPARPSAP